MTVRIGLDRADRAAGSRPWRAGWASGPGSSVIDADVVAREVLEPGEPALDAVVARFGSERAAARRIAGPGGARPQGVRGSGRARATWRRSSTPPCGRGSWRRWTGRRRTARPRSWSRRSGSSKAAWPSCVTRSGWSPATPRSSGRGSSVAARRRGRRPADRGPGGLDERVRPAATRVIDTSGRAEAARRRRRSSTPRLMPLEASARTLSG